MRLFLLALSLSFTCVASARTIVKLNPLAPSKANGEFEIVTEGAIDYQHRLNNLKEKQSYGVFLYAKGDCVNYSELIVPKFLDVSGKIDTMNSDSDALLLMQAIRHASYGGQYAPHHLLFQIELKQKIFVLEETKNGKPTGVAVACGIHE